MIRFHCRGKFSSHFSTHCRTCLSAEFSDRRKKVWYFIKTFLSFSWVHFLHLTLVWLFWHLTTSLWLHHLQGGHARSPTVRSLLLRLVGLLVLVVLHCIVAATIVGTYQHVLGTVGPLLYLGHGGVVVYRGGRTTGRGRVVRRSKPGVDTVGPGEPATQPGLVQ